MRDQKRISEILLLIEDLWNEYPDLRLGQLLFVFVFGPNDIFNWEDEVIRRKLLKHT